MTVSARILILVTIAGNHFAPTSCLTLHRHGGRYSEIVNRAMRLLREAAGVLAQTNINVDTSSSQSTSITISNTRPSTNDHTSTSAASTVLTVIVL